MVDSKYRWQKVPAPSTAIVDALTSELHTSRVMATLLAQRGITDAQQANKYFQPTMAAIHDPHQLHDMDKAVARIEQAIANNEKIVVYGDYDADGITSTSLMYETLEMMGAEVDYYVPNRFTDGYGPNLTVYRQLIEKGAQLIITVDNGVSGKDVIDKVMAEGVDVIITDHHEMPAELPQAVAIVHPRYPGSDYPFPDLSGVGVAFKVAWALTDEFPAEELDLVAIGEIADVVSVADENRSLISFGIQQLKQGMRPGLAALMKLANINPANLSGQDIGFGLAPRLNALGRIGDANEGVELLTTLDESKAQQLASQVDQANKQRQDLVNEIMQEASQQATNDANDNNQVLLIVGEGWHQGVLGIVASRIKEMTGKPTIVAATDQANPGVLKGSGRSDDRFNLFQALDPHRDLLETFGGHPAACGLSVKQANLEALQVALNNEAAKQEYDPTVKISLPIAAELGPDEVNDQLYNDLQQLAPFGPDNDEPILEMTGVNITDVKTMGQDNNHLKFKVNGNKLSTTVIAFGKGNMAPLLATPSGKVNIAFKVGINEWRGKRTVQLMLEDLQIDGTVIVDERTNRLSPQLFTNKEYYVINDAKLRENIAPHVGVDYALSLEEAQATDFANKRVTLVDCPARESDLTTIFANDNGQPAVIRLLLYQRESAYLAGMPSRNDFALLYRFVYQHKSLQWPEQRPAISKYLKINEGRLNFMIQVFSEAGFVTIESGLLRFSPDNEKTDLTQTKRYQEQLAQYKLEQQLLFNDAATVAKWLLQYLDLN